MAIIKKLKAVKKEQNHLLGIQDLSFSQVSDILNQAKTFITLNKSDSKKIDILRGKTQIKKEDIKHFIENLDINKKVREELNNITPFNYTGI